ncbi:MAG: acyltransferase [Myxococcales bacterium]|nr:acyltransferase [Myxococcales bacterium]
MRSPSSEHKAFLERRTFGSLDGIRALSVSAVVWHHTEDGQLGYPFLERGFLGVDMFFVLSGFLIVTLLLREKDRRGSISLQNFYIRRSLRIFPVYYGLLLVLSLVFLLKPDSETGQVWFQELPILLTYTANFFEVTTFMTIAWSLSAEEQFYLVWPALEKTSAKLAAVMLAFALVISQLLQFRWFTSIGLPLEDAMPEMLVKTTFTPILLGVLLAHVLHDRNGYEVMRRALGGRWAAPTAPRRVVRFVGCDPWRHLRLGAARVSSDDDCFSSSVRGSRGPRTPCRASLLVARAHRRGELRRLSLPHALPPWRAGGPRRVLVGPKPDPVFRRDARDELARRRAELSNVRALLPRVERAVRLTLTFSPKGYRQRSPKRITSRPPRW